LTAAWSSIDLAIVALILIGPESDCSEDKVPGWGDPKEDGVHCYSPGGDLLGKIHVPETVANLVFGGLLRNRLYICASTSVYACYVSTQGAAKP
jgi:hypothetical protein